MRVPVHLVSGFLGAGKTTLLTDQLARRQGRERCAVVVNDFGLARVDATLLDGAVQVQEIAGGCVCCTAPEGLVPALEAILQSQAPDRIFIEPSGLARAADLIDTLRRSPLGPRLEIAPVVVVIDPRRLGPDAPPLLLEQLDAADIVVLSRADEGGPGPEALEPHLEGRFPPLLAVVQAERGQVPLELFALRRTAAQPEHDHDHDHVHDARCGHAPSVEGWAAASRVWPPERRFDAGALRAALRAAGAERVKGLFHTDLGWYRMDRAGGGVNTVQSGSRSASAVDVILRGSVAQAEALLDALERCVPPELELGPALRVEVAGAEPLELTRAALAALPGQLPDVGAVLPGRQGQAVPLAEVLALLHTPPGAALVLVAQDGLSSGPTPLDQVGGALLVHSLGGAELPAEQGGPLRVLVPKGQSACGNVKGLVRVVVA